MQLCRDVYHCLPSQLREEDWADISRHLDLMAVEARINRANGSPPKKGKRHAKP